MTNQHLAAMQMALDALEQLEAWVNGYAQDHVPNDVFHNTGGFIVMENSRAIITALHEALAQPQGSWVDLTDDEILVCVRSQSVIENVRRAFAKFKEKNTPPVVPQGDDDLTIAYMVGYEKGKDETKEKAAEELKRINWTEQALIVVEQCAAAIRSMK